MVVLLDAYRTRGTQMASNLFIAYDLMRPGQNYDNVRKRIDELGPNYQFQLSLFYVSTNRTPEQAYALVAQALDTNDRLAVIEASGAIVSNWDRPPIAEINGLWFKP